MQRDSGKLLMLREVNCHTLNTDSGCILRVFAYTEDLNECDIWTNINFNYFTVTILKIIISCIFYTILTVFQAWNVSFFISHPLHLQCKISCNQFFEFMAYPNYTVLYMFSPARCTCVALPCLLSFLPCLSLLVSLIHSDPERSPEQS